MSGKPIGSQQRVARADGLLSAVMGDELLMMSVELGAYYNLNSVGAHIWELLASPTTAEQITQALTEQYDVEPETARAKVEAFLAALDERGLLKRVETPPA